MVALSTSMNMLIAGAVITGIATSAQQLAAAAIPELVPNQYKPMAIGKV